ncbi:MAG: DNA repair protein RecO [Deltaproteobacteria bacterium]|nr:DNA repair protein RecO [Deltaproteobacteria bacterium]
MRKEYRKAQAITLGTVDYGESDRIIDLYTLEYGRVSVIAKGARRSLKRFVGKLDPPTLLEVIYFNAPYGLSRLDSAELLDGFINIKQEVATYARACYLLELTREMTRAGQVNEKFFELAKYFLETLGSGKERGENLLRYFDIKALDLLGFLPHVEGCVVCRDLFGDGGGSVSSDIYFSSHKGGAICAGCVKPTEELTALSVGTARFLSTAARMPNEKLKRLRPNQVFLREGASVLEGFIKHLIGKEFKSASFINKLGQNPASAMNMKRY